MTDGAIRDIRVYIEFDTTRVELARCVLHAWSEARVCLSNSFYFNGRRPVPSLCFTVKVSEALRRLLLMARKMPRQLAELIASDSGRLSSFLAGVVDGDGCVEERWQNGKLKYSVVVACSRRKPLFKVLEALTSLADVGGAGAAR